MNKFKTKKRVLVLAAGFPQIQLINELHSREFFVILCDYNNNPIAKEYCDKYYQVSTLDDDAIEKIAIKEKIEFIITVCTDQALLTVGKVSERLMLPCYIDYETGLNVTNKKYMKSVFLQNNIPTAKTVIMSNYDEIYIKNMTFPLIVKPVDCNSSKGVCRINSIKYLKYAFDSALTLSRSKTVLVEEYIKGAEITVDAYVENGKANVLSISNSEIINDKNKFVIFRTCYPADISKKIENKIKKITQQIANAFNLKNSPMLIQLKTDGRNAYVLEFSARTGGGIKYLLINKVSGFDVIKAVVDLTLGKKPHVIKHKPENKFISNEFLYCEPGIFDHLEGFDELKKDGVIFDYYLFKNKGFKCDTINNSGDRVAAFTIQADKFEELEKKHKKVCNSIRIIDNLGNDILRKDLLTDLKKRMY